MKEKLQIDLCSGINPLGPSKKVKAAIRKASKHISNYPDSSVKKLKKIFYSKYGIQEDNLDFAGSLKELICLLPSVFKPERLFIFGPAPEVYEQASGLFGAETTIITPYGSPGFTSETDMIKQKTAGDLLFITNPNRITGRHIRSIDEAVARASERGAAVVIDESLLEFTGVDGFPLDRLNYDNIITLRTTANFYGLPGLELAYAVSSVPTISRLQAVKYSSVNVLAVEAARTALRDKTYRKVAREFMTGEKKLILKALGNNKNIRLHESDANVFLIEFQVPAEKVFSALDRAGFLTGRCKGASGLSGEFLRFSVMTHEHNKKFVRLLSSCLKS